MKIIFCILAVLIALGYAILDRNTSTIGKEGRKWHCVKSYYILFMSFLMPGAVMMFGFHYLVSGLYDGRMLFVLLGWFGFLGAIGVFGGIMSIRNVHRESREDMVTERLINSRITYDRYRKNYYILKGTNLNSGKDRFVFRGKDRRLMKKALEHRCTAFSVTYHKNSGRIEDIREVGSVNGY